MTTGKSLIEQLREHMALGFELHPLPIETIKEAADRLELLEAQLALCKEQRNWFARMYEENEYYYIKADAALDALGTKWIYDAIKGLDGVRARNKDNT